MPTSDDIQYAMETTRVLQEPDRRIDTFGDTRFEFQMISEQMDRVGEVKIRSGEMEALRPRLLRPDGFRDVDLDGFDSSSKEKMERMLAKLREQGRDLAVLRYGFQFRKLGVREEVVHEPIEAVRERLLEDNRRVGNPALAIIEGVDDAWEVSLLKFSLEMIMRSHEINAFDLRRRGLI
ncbi:MAG: hypothetical protein V4733_03335 [Verrucomicrobiota bacterium]